MASADVGVIATMNNALTAGMADAARSDFVSPGNTPVISGGPCKRSCVVVVQRTAGFPGSYCHGGKERTLEVTALRALTTQVLSSFRQYSKVAA